MARAYRHVEAALRYAEDVVSGEVVACEWVRLACKRQLDDLERWQDGGPYRFDPDAAERVCSFIELLPHIKGPLAGKPIRLEPWQCFILTTTFGWIKPDGKRRFRRVYIEVPRGNAKSTLSSGLALYMLALDREGGAEVYSLATTRDQARIVFSVAQHMAKRSPQYRRHFGVEVAAHSIYQQSTASKFEPLAAEGSTLDGLNIHFGCVDELHAHKSRAVYDVVETGTGKRPNSLLWIITTAGSDRAGICYEVRSYLCKVLQGVFDDDTQFGIIYSIDTDDDWTKPEALIKANPNWGVSVETGSVLALQQKALQMPSATANFQTKHLNVWVSVNQAWMSMTKWDAMGDPGLRIEDFAGCDCMIGLDLASKVDIAAKVYAFTRRDMPGHYWIFGRYYLPQLAVDTAKNSQYDGWARAGLLTVTEGSVTDYDLIERELLDDCRRFRVKGVPYDPWQATQLASHMMAQRVPMIETRQIVANMSEPMKAWEALTYEGKLHHDGNPILAWMVSNVVCHRDKKDNVYPLKERDEAKIDGVVAGVMALGRWLLKKHTPAPSMVVV